MRHLDRTQITAFEISNGINDLIAALNRTLQKKGHGTFASTHEIRGVLDEEFREVCEAMHAKELNVIASELLDLTVGAIFGYICVKHNTVEW